MGLDSRWDSTNLRNSSFSWSSFGATLPALLSSTSSVSSASYRGKISCRGASNRLMITGRFPMTVNISVESPVWRLRTWSNASKKSRPLTRRSDATARTWSGLAHLHSSAGRALSNICRTAGNRDGSKNICSVRQAYALISHHHGLGGVSGSISVGHDAHLSRLSSGQVNSVLSSLRSPRLNCSVSISPW